MTANLFPSQIAASRPSWQTSSQWRFVCLFDTLLADVRQSDWSVHSAPPPFHAGAATMRFSPLRDHNSQCLHRLFCSIVSSQNESSQFSVRSTNNWHLSACKTHNCWSDKTTLCWKIPEGNGEFPESPKTDNQRERSPEHNSSVRNRYGQNVPAGGGRIVSQCP